MDYDAFFGLIVSVLVNKGQLKLVESILETDPSHDNRARLHGKSEPPNQGLVMCVNIRRRNSVDLVIGIGVSWCNINGA